MSPAQIMPLGPDVEIRVELVTDPVWFGPALDIALWRRPPEGERCFSRTGAGFRLPIYMIEVLAYAMRTAAEQHVRGPSEK